MKLDKIKEFIKKNSTVVTLIFAVVLISAIILILEVSTPDQTLETEIPITDTANNTQAIINSARIYNLEAYNAAASQNTAAWAKLFNNLKTQDISGKADKAELQKLSDELAKLNSLLDRFTRDNKLNQELINSLIKMNNELREDLIYHTSNTTIHSDNITE